MDYKYKFTIFTPSFNRSHTIHRVYESLKAQTFRDFEWIVVDDGSTDDLKELIQRWQKESNFPIRYFYQENQGKHIAFNKAVKLANGELFLPADDDDAFVPKTLERFLYHWNNIPDHMRDKFTGVTCLCEDENGRLVGDKFPKDVIDSDELEMPHKYKVKGEKWGFHRTDVLKEFPFPNFPRVGLIPESIVWNKIASKYKKRFINEALRIYYSSSNENLSSKLKQDPSLYAFGRRLYHKENLNNYISWFVYDPIDFFKSAVNYVRFSLHLKIGLRKQWKALANWKAKALYVLALPLGWIVYSKDKTKGM